MTVLGYVELDGKRAPLTRADADVAVRMLWGEEGAYRDPEAAYRAGVATLSGLLRRYIMRRERAGWATFSEFILGNESGTKLGWSQAVRYRERNGTINGPNTVRGRLRERDVDTLPEPFRRAALDVFTGRAPLTVPHVEDFAAPSLVAQKLDAIATRPDSTAAVERWRREVSPTKNAAVSTILSRSKGPRVRVVNADGFGATEGSVVLPVLAAVVAVGFLVYVVTA